MVSFCPWFEGGPEWNRSREGLFQLSQSEKCQKMIDDGGCCSLQKKRLRAASEVLDPLSTPDIDSRRGTTSVSWSLAVEGLLVVRLPVVSLPTILLTVLWLGMCDWIQKRMSY